MQTQSDSNSLTTIETSLVLRNPTSKTRLLLVEPWAFTDELAQNEEITFLLRVTDSQRSIGISFREDTLILYPTDGDIISVSKNGSLIRRFD